MDYRLGSDVRTIDVSGTIIAMIICALSSTAGHSERPGVQVTFPRKQDGVTAVRAVTTGRVDVAGKFDVARWKILQVSATRISITAGDFTQKFRMGVKAKLG